MSKKLTSKSSAKSTKSSPEVERLKSWLEVMAEHQVEELEMEDRQGRIHIRLRGDGSAPVARTYAPAPVAQAPAAPATAPAASAKAAAPAGNLKQVLSPFVGTFYRAPSPTADPYVKEGQGIKKGQVLCIIEAMKLMNEIEAEMSGKLHSVLVENGQPVEFGEPLFLVEPSN